MKLVNLSPLPAEAIAANLDPELGIEVALPEERSEAAATAAVRDADLVLGDYQSEIPVTASVVAAMERVRHFHQPITGYDLVDVEALTGAGIPFTNAGRVTSVAMAEHTVMAALALLKSFAWCDRQVRAGAWPQHEVVGRSLVELRAARSGSSASAGRGRRPRGGSGRSGATSSTRRGPGATSTTRRSSGWSGPSSTRCSRSPMSSASSRT